MKDLYIGKYSTILKRKIQVFSSNKKDLNKLGPRLLQNIIKGITIKGNIPKEVYHAAI